MSEGRAHEGLGVSDIRRRMLLIFAVALLAQSVALAWSWEAAVTHDATNYATEDSWMYRGLANMIRDQGLLAEDKTIHYEMRVRQPGYALFLLLADGIGGVLGVKYTWIVSLLQMLLACLSCVFVYRIGAGLLTEDIGFFAGCASAVAPVNMLYSLFHMPEAISSAFWLASLWLLVVGIKRQKPHLFGLAGLCTGAAALLKPVFFYQFFALSLVLVLWHRAEWKRGLRWVPVFLLGFVVGVLPTFARNHAIWGEFSFSVQQGSQLYVYMRPHVQAALGKKLRDPSHRLTHGQYDPRVPRTKAEWKKKYGSSWDNLAKRHKVYQKLAMKEFAGQLPLLFKLWLTRQPRLYIGTGTMALGTVSEVVPDLAGRRKSLKKVSASQFFQALERVSNKGLMWYQLLTWLLLALLYAGACVGLWRLWREREWAVGLSFLALLGYFALLVTIIPSTRYRYPMTYLFALLAGVAMAWGLQRLRAREQG